MTAARVCSECGGSLEGKAPSAKTCSERCRAKRARRRSAANREQLEAQEQQAQEVVKREAPTEIERELKRQLEPVVREAIDEDVIRAIQKLVALTPKAIDAIEADLESKDPVLRGRAAALAVKYTIGHPALVKSTDEKHEQLIVNFNLPRPDDAVREPSADAEADAEDIEEDRVCDVCGEQKPVAEFVAGSDRCRACFEQRRAEVLKEFS